MGGYNSGRSGWRRKVESQHSVDIRWMKRNGWLYNGHTGRLTWNCRGEETGSISYRVTDEALTLIYRYRTHADEWKPVEAEISLMRTDCNYGGERVWMRCPCCLRRCAIVYIAGKAPACRKCLNLVYYSEAETQVDRSMRKARKAQKKLGYNEGNLSEWIPKPKGMQWKTYERHIKVIDQANDFFCRYAIDRFNLEF